MLNLLEGEIQKHLPQNWYVKSGLVAFLENSLDNRTLEIMVPMSFIHDNFHDLTHRYDMQNQWSSILYVIRYEHPNIVIHAGGDQIFEHPKGQPIWVIDIHDPKEFDAKIIVDNMVEKLKTRNKRDKRDMGIISFFRSSGH